MAVVLLLGAVFVLVWVRPPHPRPPANRPGMTKVQSDMETILRAADIVRDNTGSYPASVREMVDPDGPLEVFPLDPWGREYRYEIIDGTPRVSCLGKDGVEGGEGESADLVWPELENP